MDVPVSKIVEISILRESAVPKAIRKIAFISSPDSPNVHIALSEALTATGSFGMERDIVHIFLHADEPQRFVNAVRQNL